MTGHLAILDRIHRRIVQAPVLQLFTAATRGLLAAAFIPSGVTKVLGQRFTSLPVSSPIGYFFDAFFQAHTYYAFIGWAQLIAAILLLVPATATAGALVYLPIIANVFLITLTLRFTGTWIITGMMLLANLWLLCWDLDRLKPLLGPPRPSAPVEHELPAALRAATSLVAAFGPVALFAALSVASTVTLIGIATVVLVPAAVVLAEYRRQAGNRTAGTP